MLGFFVLPGFLGGWFKQPVCGFHVCVLYPRTCYQSALLGREKSYAVRGNIICQSSFNSDIPGDDSQVQKHIYLLSPSTMGSRVVFDMKFLC